MVQNIGYTVKKKRNITKKDISLMKVDLTFSHFKNKNVEITGCFSNSLRWLLSTIGRTIFLSNSLFNWSRRFLLVRGSLLLSKQSSRISYSIGKVAGSNTG
jgi:hypothetical protein